VTIRFAGGVEFNLLPPGYVVPALPGKRRLRRFFSSVPWDKKKPHLDRDLSWSGLIHDLEVLKAATVQLCAADKIEQDTAAAVIDQVDECLLTIRGHGNRPREWHNLITGSNDKDILFLQFAVYAAREGWLSPEAEQEAVLRFEKRFKKAIGHLSPERFQEGNRQDVERGILFDAWESVKQGYCLPGTEEAFSRYARHVVSLVKRLPFSRDAKYWD
jgi:hypothetical protein